MYSGTTFTRLSGRVMGAHQKIDRIARRHLTQITQTGLPFPTVRQILHFEGQNGPDAIKRKSPAIDEPWHFFNPFKDEDNRLLDMIDDHYQALVDSLRQANQERAAFEAAWLAHAMVDGLTPAHHYPYEEKLIELSGGQGIETRTTFKTRWLIRTENRRELVRNNWKMWGAKGLITTHGTFELGFASLIMPLTFSDVVPSPADRQRVLEVGLRQYFLEVAREIAVLGLYDKYMDRGWTPKLAYDMRHKLAPAMVRTVTLAWYAALVDAGAITP